MAGPAARRVAAPGLAARRPGRPAPSWSPPGGTRPPRFRPSGASRRAGAGRARLAVVLRLGGSAAEVEEARALVEAAPRPPRPRSAPRPAARGAGHAAGRPASADGADPARAARSSRWSPRGAATPRSPAAVHLRQDRERPPVQPDGQAGSRRAAPRRSRRTAYAPAGLSPARRSARSADGRDGCGFHYPRAGYVSAHHMEVCMAGPCPFSRRSTPSPDRATASGSSPRRRCASTCRSGRSTPSRSSRPRWSQRFESSQTAVAWIFSIAIVMLGLSRRRARHLGGAQRPAQGDGRRRPVLGLRLPGRLARHRDRQPAAALPRVRRASAASAWASATSRRSRR